MPLAGRPFLTFMLDWLREHGVDDVLLSCGFLAHAVEDVLGEEYNGVRLRYVHEDEPLGTAGPVRLAADEGLLQDRVFILNGDVLTDMDLTAQLAFHEEEGAKATLALIAVEDTSSYGVVPTDENGAVLEFLEKSPGPAPTDRINAGAYVIERDVVERIPAGRAVSFEREVFPGLVGEGLYGFHSEGYWIDIGTPERYLESTYDLLSGRVHSTLPPRDETGSLIYEPALIAGAHIGPQTVLGPHCSVGADSVVERSVLHSRVMVGSGCIIREAVLAEGVQVGDGAEIEPGAMLGDGVVVEPGEVVEGDARLEPGARVG
jgi:mannose-1-phosphate guanylyltransferase